MKRFLAVGINHFLHPGNDLAGCVADTHSMIVDVMPLAGIEAQSAQCLTDSSARKVNVMHALDTLLIQARNGQLSYLGFSWSGHGTHYSRPEEEDGLGEALCCYEITEQGEDWDPDTIIKDVELRDLLNQFPATCKVEVWLDTCYSGGMDRIMRAGAAGRFLHNPGNPERRMRVANANMAQGLNSNIAMWCASSEGQTSADAYIKDGYHGAFTWFWVKAYLDGPRTSRLELLLKTRAMLSSRHYDQLPRLKAWNKMVQGQVGA